MNKKTKLYLGAFLLLGLILFFIYIFLNPKKSEDGFSKEMEEINSKEWEQTGEFDREEDESITFELSLLDKCNQGEWIEVKEIMEGIEIKEFSGVLISFEENGIFYELESGSGKLNFARPEYGEFLEGRNISTVVSVDNDDFIVHKVKCIDEEIEYE